MSRLIALDMLRGYALLCIMLDHMPVSAMHNLTLTNFAVFDAAELFVLLSGFLVGIVWQSVERKDGRRTAQWRFARRAFEVWRALIIGGLIMALLSAGLLALGMRHTAIWNQYAVWIVENPWGYLGVLATLWLQPNLIDVLAVYVVLIASAPLLVPVLLRHPTAFAVGSVVLWWFAPLWGPLLPNHNSGGMLFNPFGWQMLFYSGVAMGLFRRDFMPRLLEYRSYITPVAAVIVLLGAVYALAADFGEAGKSLRATFRLAMGDIDKWSLDGARYLSIIAASWLVAAPLAGIMARIAATRGGVAMQQIGKGGLWSFICCVLLSVLGDAFQMNPADQAVWRRLLVDVWAVITLWWLSAMWMDYGAPRQKARKTAQGTGS